MVLPSLTLEIHTDKQKLHGNLKRVSSLMRRGKLQKITGFGGRRFSSALISIKPNNTIHIHFSHFKFCKRSGQTLQ